MAVQINNFSNAHCRYLWSNNVSILYILYLLKKINYRIPCNPDATDILLIDQRRTNRNRKTIVSLVKSQTEMDLQNVYGFVNEVFEITDDNNNNVNAFRVTYHRAVSKGRSNVMPLVQPI